MAKSGVQSHKDYYDLACKMIFEKKMDCRFKMGIARLG